MQAHHTLLLAGLDRHEAHAWPRRRLADRRGVGGVVLAVLAFHAIGGDEVGRNQPRVQPQRAQLAGPVVRARARLHRHQAAYRKQRAPSGELIAPERACHYPPARCIHRVNLDHLLGKVNTDPRDDWCSCNLTHGLPLFSFRLMFASQSWRFDTVTGRWEVPSYSRGRTPARRRWGVGT